MSGIAPCHEYTNAQTQISIRWQKIIHAASPMHILVSGQNVLSRCDSRVRRRNAKVTPQAWITTFVAIKARARRRFTST